MLENGSDLHIYTSVRRYDTIALGLLKNRKKNAKIAIFHFAWTNVNGAIIAMLFNLIEIINNNEKH